MKVSIRFPDYSFDEQDFDPGVTIFSAIEKICTKNKHLPSDRVKLVCNSQQMIPEKVLQDYNVQEGSVIEVLISFRAPVIDPRDVTYDEFMMNSLPLHGEAEIPTSIQPLIFFKHNSNGLSINLECLDCLYKNCASGVGGMQDMLGEDIAAEMGFVRWTMAEVQTGLLLLEISPDLMLRFDRIKYSWRVGSRYYTGGDRHSWQRYTTVLPLDATISVDTSALTARILPAESLKPNQMYGILLANGVATIPMGDSVTPWYGYCRPGILEDKIIVFKTKAELPDAIQPVT